ncbi:hypothetical protein GCM10023116_01340 [Kistimonas scapharcae]|uniref:Ankyrin n=1 Tax=Kistimonas scapharcae TaxID=1036133 RepID=A0ABP8UWB4_9GAMM
MATLLARAGHYDIKDDAPQRALRASIRYQWDDKIACILLTDLYKKNNPHDDFTYMLGMATKRFSNTVLRHIIHRNITSLDQPLYAGARSPLLYAIDFNNTEAAMMLIEANADIEAEHEKTVSFPLKAAAYHNNIHVTKALIDKGAKVNKSITMTPALLKYLKENYHDGVTPTDFIFYDPPNLPEDYTYSTPLWAATAKNHEDIVSLLLNAGANPNHGGESTLFAIEKNTSINIAAMLIEAGASFTRKAYGTDDIFSRAFTRKAGGTDHILSRAYYKQHTPLCALLLNLGISPNTIDEHRWAILDNKYLEKDQCRQRKQYQGVFRLFNQWLKFPNISPNDMSLADRCRFICRKQMGKRVMNLYCVHSPIALDVFKKYSPPKPGTPPGIMDYLAYHTEIL